MNRKEFTDDFAKLLEHYGVVKEGKYHLFFELVRSDDDHVEFKDMFLANLKEEDFIIQ